MIASNQYYGESVLFAFIKNGLVLCEWRQWKETVKYSIPGGKVDPSDRQEIDYKIGALLRETREELQVIPTYFEFVGEIWFDAANWLFYVYMIRQWQGKLPKKVFDSQRRLNWIDPQFLQDTYSMPGIAAMLQKAIRAGG